MWVVCGPGSKGARPASERSEKRSVRLVLHANAAAEPASIVSGRLDSFPGIVAAARGRRI